VDLFCGLGGWTEGFLAEGWDVIGIDIERHIYGEHRYPAQLVLQDVRTLHGRQFKDAAIIVASSPCQEFSYRAMPWKRAKALGPPLLGMELFAQAGRIQREASEAAGRYIPMIQENVRGAQKYVGRAQWNYGSYYLWGDVPALMPIAMRGVMKVGVAHRSNGETNFHGSAARGLGDGVKVGKSVNWSEYGKPGYTGPTFHHSATKNTGGSWFNVAHNTTSGVGNNARDALVAEGRKNDGDAVKGVGLGSASWQAKEDRHPNDPRNFYSKSSARKAASARIAKIPFHLASHIARTFLPLRGVA
jgi:hypothetical protein